MQKTDRSRSQQDGFFGIVAWSLWRGTALMITSGMLAFAMQ